MFGLGQVWSIVYAPLRWVSQMPFAMQWGLLVFGLAMTRFGKRNQKGLIFSASLAATALLAVAWVNSLVPLTAPILIALRSMPLWANALAVAASAAGFGALAALATSFTQIKLNRYIALAAGYDHFTFAPDISEERVRFRCGLGGLGCWLVEAGMLFGLSRFPHSFRAELPQAFAQPPLYSMAQGAFSAEVIVAAIAVAGAGGVVAAMFRLSMRNRNPRISARIYVLRMIAYLVMMVFASVSGAVCLAVACAASLSLSARFARMGYCKPEDCIPPLWFALEERHCLLCGRMNAPVVRSQRRAVVSREEIRELSRVHLLSAQNDSAFLRSDMSRDALWHMRFGEGDSIVVCASCRKVFFAEDFSGACPLCEGHHKLWFSRPAALLMHRKTRLPSGATVERPYETAVLHCEEVRHRRMPDGPAFAEYPIWLLMPAAMYVAILFTCG